VSSGDEISVQLYSSELTIQQNFGSNPSVVTASPRTYRIGTTWYFSHDTWGHCAYI